MSIFKLCAAALASVCIASSAQAVTVKASGTINTIDYGTVDAAQASIGETLTFSMDIDTASAPTAADRWLFGGGPFASFGDIRSGSGLRYEATSGYALFEDSGLKLDLGTGAIQVSVYELDDSMPGVSTGYRMTLELENFGYPDFAIATSWLSDTTPFDLSLDYALQNLDKADETFSYFGLSAADIGYDVSSCTYCSANHHVEIDLVGLVVSTSTGPNVVQPVPPVAAVPLPAPFVMLGAAMLGLAGLGRRRNA